VEEAREIWDAMAKVNENRCEYWLDRIAWEKYTRCTHLLTLRENGDYSSQFDLFRMNLFNVTDDPTRFCYSYLSFLASGYFTIDRINDGYAAIRKVFKKQVPSPPLILLM